ncbi:MAG: hypothetical protein V7L11_28155 [Nostoc sp.]|uniref:WD40 repeat domain-containing protein n=1 Tax=Nostoc sp. TaxID=1180 RepID=UPI002FFA5749
MPIIQPYQTLKGHSAWIYAIAISPDGNTLASGKLLTNYAGHTKSVWSVAFSPNGQTLVSGSGDETIKLWSVPRDPTKVSRLDFKKNSSK